MTTNDDGSLSKMGIPIFVHIWDHFKVSNVLQRLEVIYAYAVQLQKIRQSSSKYIGKVWFWREIPPSPLNQCWKSTKESWLTFPISICNIMIVLHKQWHWYQHWLRGRGGFFTPIPFFHKFLTMIVFNSMNGSSEYL